MESLLIACDFDGTITLRDTLHLIVDEFGDPGIWEAIEPRLRAGELTLVEAMEREFASVRATPDQVRELVLREAGLRPGFRELVAWSRDAGHRLEVYSSGFRSVIDALLGRWGLTDLRVTSHDCRFTPEGCRLVWAERGDLCALCGRHCKRHDLRASLREERLVYIGDGISDRCSAKMADLVFARHHLARDLASDGFPFLPFEDFVEVRERLDGPLPLAA